MSTDTLALYPHVVVRLDCLRCNRKGAYRLARLAARYGAEVDMGELLLALSADCEMRKPRHPYGGRCQARFTDLENPPPPDFPGRPGLRVVKGGRAA